MKFPFIIAVILLFSSCSSSELEEDLNVSVSAIDYAMTDLSMNPQDYGSAGFFIWAKTKSKNHLIFDKIEVKGASVFVSGRKLNLERVGESVEDCPGGKIFLTDYEISVAPYNKVVRKQYAEKKLYPSLGELRSLLTRTFDSTEVESFIKKYGLIENHKRKKSYGSGIGIFMRLGPVPNMSKITVRLQAQEARYAYQGELELGLTSEDTPESAYLKLKPQHDFYAYEQFGKGHEMIYVEDMALEFLRGKLYEIHFEDCREYLKEVGRDLK